MPLRVYQLGPILEDGGTIFVCSGAPANAGIRWTLVGPRGGLTPIGTRTSSGGAAIAIYNPRENTPALRHSRVFIQAEVFP